MFAALTPFNVVKPFAKEWGNPIHSHIKRGFCSSDYNQIRDCFLEKRD